MKVAKDFPKAIVQISKRFSKGISQVKKYFALSPKRKARTSKTKDRSWVNPNKTFAIKKIFERESSLEEKFKSLPSSQIKIFFEKSK